MTGPDRVYVFDPTALVLLFAGHQPAYDLYETVARVVIPTAAIGEANVQIQANEDAWEAVLLAPNVTVLDLTATAALAASSTGPTLGMGHAIYETIGLNGILVTGKAVTSTTN